MTNNIFSIVGDENKTTFPNNFKSPDVGISSRPRLKALTLQELYALEIEPKEPIIYPILNEGSLAMLYAKTGVGKTFVSLELALTVANGGEMFDGRWKASKPKKVLFIDGEMSIEEMLERTKNISKRKGTEFSMENFSMISQETQEADIPDIGTEEGQLAIEDCIQEDTKLIILDNLSTLLRSGRENDSESWTAVQSWLVRLRKRKIAVLIVHHAGKNGDYRGASKKTDILNTIIKLEQPIDYKQSDGTKFQVKYEKTRNFTGNDRESFEVVLTDDGFITKDLESNTFIDKVLELRKQDFSLSEIADRLGITKSKTHRLLQKAKNF